MERKYKNKDWLYEQHIILQKTSGQIGMELYPIVMAETIRKWLKKYNIYDKNIKPNKVFRKKWLPEKVIYFVRSENRKIKIGITKNIKNRMSSLRNGSPVKLELIHMIIGNINLEIELHEKFKKYHSHGEWFNESEKILDWIKKNPS